MAAAAVSLGAGSGVAAAIRAFVQYVAADRAPAVVLAMPVVARGAASAGETGLAAAAFTPAKISEIAVPVIASALVNCLMK
ncbi:hypothetical protein GCM10023196_087370 [Actinoallomurus vinaceus]|uniref:Uncharacterized protein n=1 Tax=Actinoallomurus vinaceus TaxID=1080074 RepID=A0ABP8UPG2_9ACTN